MAKKLHLTLACGDYEIVRALKEGSVQPDGIELTVLTAMDSSPRHWRFFRKQEYDVAEVSTSAYLAARDQGQRALLARAAFAPGRRCQQGRHRGQHRQAALKSRNTIRRVSQGLHCRECPRRAGVRIQVALDLGRTVDAPRSCSRQWPAVLRPR